MCEWNGFKMEESEFKDRYYSVVYPDTKPNGNWLLKTEYRDAFPNFEIEMLKRGWHVLYIRNITRWCLDSDIDLKAEFLDYAIKKYNLKEKGTLVGMSCGGMIAVKFTAKYPKYINSLYLDAPVMNLLSCPAGLGKGGDDMYEEFVTATNKTIEDLICYREHPMDKVPNLYKNNIPVIMLYGTADNVVPYTENGIFLEKYYKEHKGIIKTIGKEGLGHHPHGLDDPAPIIEFVEKYAK